MCLENVHTYFRKNPSYAVSWKLQENQGPQSREDRFDGTKLNYLGQPQKFKFFSRSAFDKVLLLIRTGATLESLSEDEFMSALDLTTKVCSNNAFVRNYVSPYAGPQCYVQRRNDFIMGLEPRPEAAVSSVPRVEWIDDAVEITIEWISCDVCEKWRRVDARTYLLYHNDTWFRESARSRREQLLEDFRALATQTIACLLYTSPSPRDS